MTPARSAATAAASAASLAALAVLLLTACGGDVSWCGSSGRDGGHVAIGYNTDPARLLREARVSGWSGPKVSQAWVTESVRQRASCDIPRLVA